MPSSCGFPITTRSSRNQWTWERSRRGWTIIFIGKNTFKISSKFCYHFASFRHELVNVHLFFFTRSGKECVDDINLMFKNCYMYNKPEEDVCVMANSLEKFFLSKVKAMPPVEVELTQDMMRRGGMSSSGNSKTKKSLGLAGSSAPDLGDSDSMQSAASDPLEIKPPIKPHNSNPTQSINSSSGMLSRITDSQTFLVCASLKGSTSILKTQEVQVSLVICVGYVLEFTNTTILGLSLQNSSRFSRLTPIF